MRVCHITTTHPVFDSRIFRKECVSLAKLGYQVFLIAAHSKEETIDGVKIIPVRKWVSFKERVWDVPREAIRVANEINADLYHFHDPELFPHMVRWAKNNGKKVIWDAHENYQDTIWRLNSLKWAPISWLGARWFNRLELKAGKNVLSGIVTITDKMAQKYLREGINTCVLANYADLSKFNYKGNISLSEKPRLISSGSHFRGRGVIEIAKSLGYIQQEIDAELYFTGRFSDEKLLSDTKQVLKEVSPSEENWKIEGTVSFDYLVNQAIPKAWVGLVLFDISDPNNRNGLPNRFFECWANGVPVITTKGTQVAKLVDTHQGGIVIENNQPKSIANAFLKIAKDRKWRDQMSRSAFQAVRNQYNWETNFQDLKVFYQEILSGS